MDKAQITRAMDRDGCVLVPQVFSGDVLDELETEYDWIVAQLQRSGEEVNGRWESAARYQDAASLQVLHTHQVQNYSARWLHAFLHPQFLAPTTAILGHDVTLHHSKLFFKPPSTGAPFPMHQDWRYFPTERDSMIAAIIHLSDTDLESGCLLAYPGSHRLGRAPSFSGLVKWDDPDRFLRWQEQYPTADATPYPAQRGDVFFFSYFTVHGSGPNTSPRPRKTVLTQMFSGTDRLEPSEHPVAGIVLSGRNNSATRRSVAAATT